jgi:hypothetical protein
LNAILAQIEAGMPQEQLDAIAAMRLTQDDLQAWARSQGLGQGGRGESEPSGGPKGGQGGGRGESSAEEMKALRGTAEAGGGRVGARSGQFIILLDPLIDLLTQRAAE